MSNPKPGSLRFPAILSYRLWKLVSDAWLDRADTYRIRTVGFYFAGKGPWSPGRWAP